jgi:uncharacterized protein YhaN
MADEREQLELQRREFELERRQVEFEQQQDTKQQQLPVISAVLKESSLFCAAQQTVSIPGTLFGT